MESFFVQKKTLIIEILVLVMFLFGAYYLYSIMKEGEATTTQTQVSERLLGQNFALFIKAMDQDKISFRDIGVLRSDLASRLRDFSEEILPTQSRGRADPFIPYAFTGSLR